MANQPTLYELSGNGIHVTYATSSLQGQPQFNYHDAFQARNFTGNQIQTVDTVLGRLVTVFLVQTVDSGSTTFTLLVPSVRLAEFSPASIHTIGIATSHKFSVIPAMNLGQTETYTTTELSGTASMVLF